MKQTTKPALTIKQLQAMDDTELAGLKWEDIEAVLSSAGEPVEPWVDPDPPAPLTLDDIRRMTDEQINANWKRIEAALKAAYQPTKGQSL